MDQPVEENIVETNKENYDISLNESRLSKHSRKSILICLDPLNPYSSPVIKEQTSSDYRANSSVESCDEANQPNLLDNSWNFMQLNNVNEYSDMNVENNLSPFDILQNEDLLTVNVAYPMTSDLNEAQLLELSVEVDDVAVDDLLSLSPQKKYVDHGIHNLLKKYHKSKHEEWSLKEKTYMEEMNNLKLEIESQMNLLKLKEDEENQMKEEICALIEKESNMQKKMDEKESMITELLLENEENLEKLRLDFSRNNAEKEDKINQYNLEISDLQQEVTSLNSTNLLLQIRIGETHDSMDELIEYSSQEISNLMNEIEGLKTLIEDRTNLSQRIISSLKQNEAGLLQQLSSYQEKMKHLEKEFAQKLETIQSSEANFEKEKNALLDDFRQKLKKKDVKIALLKEDGSNLQAELILRTKERDQLRVKLDSILE